MAPQAPPGSKSPTGWRVGSEFDLLVLDDAQSQVPRSARRDALHAADFAILCLHDDAAREAVAMAEGSKVRIIDASTAHRVAPGWVYGFPEIEGREAVANAARVSNPGCYSTGFIALLAPLVRGGLLPADWPYTCNAVSGYSGGGKALIERFAADGDIAWRGYALALGHKHVPGNAGPLRPDASAAVHPGSDPGASRNGRGNSPAPRAPCPVPPRPMPCARRWPRFTLAARLCAWALRPKMANCCCAPRCQASDAMELFVFASPDSTQARLVARLDNLGKGASGAAVQSLNLMAGCEETAGLRL